MWPTLNCRDYSMSVRTISISTIMLCNIDENLNGFLTSPKAYMPGTKMSFAGLPKVEDRANVIAYLAATQ